VGVRTSASFVRHGETGIGVDRLPPGAYCVKYVADAVALDAFVDAIEQAQAIDRPSVRAIAAEQFDTDRIVDAVITLVNTVRLAGGIKTAASV
jgi:hypothetical protein